MTTRSHIINQGLPLAQWAQFICLFILTVFINKLGHYFILPFSIL